MNKYDYSHIRTKMDYYRTVEFIRFAKRVKRTMLEFVVAHVVRESEIAADPNYGGNWIYKNFYLKGMLVARFSQEDIAKYFETKQSHVSEYLSELEEDGLIIKLPIYTNVGKILYYQVGYWEGNLNKDDYEETLFFNIKFDAYSKLAKAKRRENKIKVPESMVEMLDTSHCDYERLRRIFEGKLNNTKCSDDLYPKNG